MKKPLHILLLEYLSNEQAFVHEIDIKNYFIQVLQSFDDKTEFNSVLQYLNDMGFIYTMAREIQYGDIKDVNIRASILPKGEQYLKSMTLDRPTYNLPNSNNVIIAHHSSVDNTLQANKSPIKKPIINANNNHKNKSNSSTLKTIVAGVVVVIIGIIITVYLRSCGVNAHEIIRK